MFRPVDATQNIKILHDSLIAIIANQIVDARSFFVSLSAIQVRLPQPCDVDPALALHENRADHIAFT